MDKPIESDWKLFRKRVPEWRERFLEERNQRLAALLVDGRKTPTERFWNAEKELKSIARILSDCLDGHSRSKMEMYLHLMCRHRMISEEDLGEFSDELRARALTVMALFK